jgi:hypothetical protein
VMEKQYQNLVPKWWKNTLRNFELNIWETWIWIEVLKAAAFNGWGRAERTELRRIRTVLLKKTSNNNKQWKSSPFLDWFLFSEGSRLKRFRFWNLERISLHYRTFVFKGTPGWRQPTIFLKIMFASHKSMKMRVVCTLECMSWDWILVEMRRSEVRGVWEILHDKASKILFIFSHKNDHAKI